AVEGDDTGGGVAALRLGEASRAVGSVLAIGREEGDATGARTTTVLSMGGVVMLVVRASNATTVAPPAMTSAARIHHFAHPTMRSALGARLPIDAPVPLAPAAAVPAAVVTAAPAPSARSVRSRAPRLGRSRCHASRSARWNFDAVASHSTRFGSFTV